MASSSNRPPVFHDQELAEIARLEGLITRWEEDFYASARRFTTLSPKQLAILDRLNRQIDKLIISEEEG